MHPQELSKAYRNGENITSLLKAAQKQSDNVEEIVEIAYDLQAGSYIKALAEEEYRDQKVQYGKAVAKEILSLTSPSTLLEAGIGEGTTFSFVIDALASGKLEAHGFDISWSRVAECRYWFEELGHSDVALTVASLFHIPYADNSFDVIYTSHAVEPNGGMEKDILKELYRVASRYVVLLEPAYEFASDEARVRMESHGYCQNLAGHAKALGMRVVKHQQFVFAATNPLNPTGLTVIEKAPEAPSSVPQLICPRYGGDLDDHGGSLYSPDSMRAYPKIQGIPCLRRNDGIIASAYDRHL